MALTSDIKDELARIDVSKSAVRAAELATILRLAGGLHLVSGKVVIEVELDSAQVARRVRKDLAELFGCESELSVISAGGIRKTSRYQIRVLGQGDTLARQTGLVDSRGRPARGLPATLVAGSIGEAQAVWRGAFASFIIFALFGSIVLVIWQGVLLKEAGEIQIGELFSFILYSVFVGASFGGTADLFARIQKAVGATEHLFDLLDQTPEDIDLIAVHPEKNKIEGALHFNNVSFHYASRPDITVLKNIDFKALPGENIAIVGPSGAGKSTLVSLVLRFYEPTSGSISVDGKQASDFSLNELRSQMAIVPQEVLLFGGSIRENIAYGKPDASDEEIQLAAEKANAHEFIQRFPDGMNTLVGERGIQLSGGQRQRIAIARAILKNPKILILDEATSSLDSESERLVQEALESLMQNRTSIVIAHRLSTIRKANRILVLENGEIVEQGSHNELIEKTNGVYQKLSKLQFEGA
jgi:ABC-type multidrug transport system fused ATPase/permease subunit